VTPISLVDQVTLKMETAHISERLIKPTKLHSYIHGRWQGMQIWHVTPRIKKKQKLKRYYIDTHNVEQSVKIFVKGLNILVSLSAHFLSAHSHMPQQ
jgi:hypothetical protein